MNPGGQKKGDRHQRVSEDSGPEQASPRDSLLLQHPVPHHKHCSPSPRGWGSCWVKARGAKEGTWGNPNRGPSPDSGFPPPPSSPPHQEKAGAGNPTPTGLQIKDWQKCDSNSVPVTDCPPRHVQKPRRHGRPPPKSSGIATQQALPSQDRMPCPSHPNQDRTG